MAGRLTHGRGKFAINTRVPTPTRTVRRSVKCDFIILCLRLEYTRLCLCVYIEREQIYRDDRFYRKLYSSWIRVGRYIAAVQAAVTLVEDISYNPC